MGFSIFNQHVGPPHSRSKTYSARIRMSRASGPLQPQQRTRRPPLLLSIDGTDRRTHGRTLDRLMTLTAYVADRVKIYANIHVFDRF